MEICEDLWAAVPPSSFHAIAGATVILNPSASNELVAKAEYRRELVKVAVGPHHHRLRVRQRGRARVHAPTSSSAASSWSAENGVLLAEGERFKRDGDLLVTDVDTERLLVERARQTSFAEGVHALARSHRRIALAPVPAPRPHRLVRRVEVHPFVPDDPATLDDRCREIFSIQTAGLARRLEHTRVKRAVLGLSGGLDSTLALLVARADLRPARPAPRGPAGRDHARLRDHGAHAARTPAAWPRPCGVELREIDIRAACEQHIRDIGLDPADRQSVTFQNLQARERTQILMDLANKEDGLVVGTADLSELALGFGTFGGDLIAMYNVNCGVPKTLVRKLVGWVAGHETTRRGAHGAPVQSWTRRSRPELVAPGGDGGSPSGPRTSSGPYELHDFFLYACCGWARDRARRCSWRSRPSPAATSAEAVRRWLRVFVTRFFEQQYKRSLMPDGPKVGSVALSPRGDWRMPSDASPAAWLAELE